MTNKLSQIQSLQYFTTLLNMRMAIMLILLANDKLRSGQSLKVRNREEVR